MQYFNDESMHLKQETVLTIGNFDGFHRGHMKLVESVKEVSRQKSLHSLILSFWPHPGSVLQNVDMKYIFTKEEKISIAEGLGAEIFVNYPFTKEFASLSGEDFIKDVLVGKLNSKAIVVGEGFLFGKGKKFDTVLLKECASRYGVQVFEIPLANADNIKISSSEIRKYISQGKIRKANNLLGRDYFIDGIVLPGKQIGQKIGFPTMNITPSDEKLIPPNGVYITSAVVGGQEYNSVTNIGNNITFGYVPTTVETFADGFCANAYGEGIRVYFKEMIRQEKRFENKDMLISQITQDLEKMRNYYI